MAGQIVAVLILTVLLSRTLSEEVPEFQYPCYVDVCTFPSQFCNSDKYERRCSPCSRAICRQPNVPLACRYICLKHNELTTTVEPTSTTLVPSRQQSTSQGNENLASLHLIMSYSAVSTTLLVVVLLAFVAYYIHRKKLAKEKSKRFDHPSVGYRGGFNRGRNCEPNEGLLQELALDNNELVCPECGQRPRPELHLRDGTSPPSYATCDQRGNLFSRSDTASTPSSTESVHNLTKTVKVKPMAAKQEAKVNNNIAAENTRHNVLNDAEMQTTPLLESLINSTQSQDNEETSLKMSNI